MELSPQDGDQNDPRRANVASTTEQCATPDVGASRAFVIASMAEAPAERAQHIERSLLTCSMPADAAGPPARTGNLNKRHQIAAACYNLSHLLRRLYGIGTPKQWRRLSRCFFVTLALSVIAGAAPRSSNPKHTHQGLLAATVPRGQFEKSRVLNSLLTTQVRRRFIPRHRNNQCIRTDSLRSGSARSTCCCRDSSMTHQADCPPHVIKDQNPERHH